MPRGCQGAACETEFTLFADALAGDPSIRRVLGADLRVVPRFTVAMNSIAQPHDREEPYRFLPQDKGTQHQFTDFASWFSGSIDSRGIAKYEGEVQLNPEWGRSSTEFVPVHPDQAEFFPAFQHLSLHFQFKMTLPALFHKETIHIFNKEPMRFVTDAPLDGFPPLDGPAFKSLGPVDMYDVSNPNGAPIGRFGKGNIIPIASVTYALDVVSLTSSDDRSLFSGEISVRRNDGVEPVATALMIRSFPGCEMVSESNSRFVVGDKQHNVKFTVRRRNASLGAPGIFVRAASIDPEHLGFDRLDVTFPESPEDNEEETESGGALKGRKDGGVRSKSGDAFRFDPKDLKTNELEVLDPAGTEARVEHVWIAPHGVKATSTGGKLTAHLPRVSKPTEVWFTHYRIVNGKAEEPEIVRVVVDP